MAKELMSTLLRRLEIIAIASALVASAHNEALAKAAAKPDPTAPPVISGPALSSTINSSCDAHGNCQNGTLGVGRAAQVTCTRAIGNNPITYPPSCYFYCVPNCGLGTLRVGESGHTSGAGTVTLNCNGQVPLECSLRVDIREDKVSAESMPANQFSETLTLIRGRDYGNSEGIVDCPNCKDLTCATFSPKQGTTITSVKFLTMRSSGHWYRCGIQASCGRQEFSDPSDPRRGCIGLAACRICRATDDGMPAEDDIQVSSN
jgi:hypothetical protein